MSSTLFRDYEYYTFKKYIKKGNLAFFIARHPELDKYVFIGFLYMKDKPGRRTKHVKKFYYFRAIKEKSIRFPLNEKKTIVFDRKFTEKLPPWVYAGKSVGGQLKNIVKRAG